MTIVRKMRLENDKIEKHTSENTELGRSIQRNGCYMTQQYRVCEELAV